MPRGARARAEPKEVDNSKFYEILDIPKTADESDVKKAFRKAAMIHHPDKGGDPEKFKEIQRAYEVLSDKEKRAIYDEHGEDGLDGNVRGGGDDDDILSQMFGGGGGRSSQRKVRKGNVVVFPMAISLEDMYNGATKKLRLTRNVICSGCEGKGGKNAKQCTGCRGQGVRLAVRQIGPGMITQTQVQCSQCQGTGTIMAPGDKCNQCHGEKVVKEQKHLDVFVPRGAREGQRQVFTGAGDEAPDIVAGDVEVLYKMKPHNDFRREGNHLFIKRKIKLIEALTEFKLAIEHLDGRALIIQHNAKKEGPIRPNDVYKIPDEGMPINGSIHNMGDLYVEFEVVFPTADELPANEAALKALLPKPEPFKAPAEGKSTEDVTLTRVDMDEERRKFDSEQRQQDEEEEDARGERGGGHGHGATCQQA